MKKTALLAALIAASAVGSSYAGSLKTNIVTIAGSTAFQAAAIAGLDANYNGTNGWALAARSGDGASATKDTYRLYTNTTVSGTTTNKNFIAIHWTGSEGGLQALANQKSVLVNFLPVTASGTSVGNAAATTNLPVNIAFSDILQANSHFIGKGYAPFQDTLTYDVLGAPTKIGVLGFGWYASSNFPGSIPQYEAKLVYSTNGKAVSTNDFTTNTSLSDVTTSLNSALSTNAAITANNGAAYSLTNTTVGYTQTNVASGLTNVFAVTLQTNSLTAPSQIMTKEIAQELFVNGYVPLARFTGSTNDLSTKVYLVGRDPDSGTRTSALLNAGLPATATVQQYSIDTNGVQSLYGQATVNGLSIPAGQSGYSSTGGVQSALQYANKNGIIAVGYMGAGNTAPGVVQLNHEGTILNAVTVETGNSAFWTYEELYQPKVALTGLAQSVYNTLASWYQTAGNFASQSSASYLHLQDMQVHRTGDQTPISQGAVSH
jgi:hypothetical protein